MLHSVRSDRGPLLGWTKGPNKSTWRQPCAKRPSLYYFSSAASLAPKPAGNQPARIGIRQMFALKCARTIRAITYAPKGDLTSAGHAPHNISAGMKFAKEGLGFMAPPSEMISWSVLVFWSSARSAQETNPPNFTRMSSSHPTEAGFAPFRRARKKCAE